MSNNYMLEDKGYVRMIEGFIADDNRYLEEMEEKTNEAVELGADDQVILEWNRCLDLARQYISEWSERLYENHWYIRIPFTNKRLIFAGARYVGWYEFK